MFTIPTKPIPMKEKPTKLAMPVTIARESSMVISPIPTTMDLETLAIL